MSKAEIIVRLSALCLLCGYLLVGHWRRARTNRKAPVRWNGEVFDAKPLCAKMEQLRKSQAVCSPTPAREGSRRRNLLKLVQNSVSRFVYFRRLRENASRLDS